MDPTAPAQDAPQLRTLLLTDLCDSTGLVERLGDQAAAAFFREHDHYVLELQQRWRGRLIDRSDGLLLMFERPIDGLGFALNYRRGLDALGQAHGAAPLRARAGLHVGEVLIWRNSEEAVQAGAKSMEIEGLAKPLAARLMQLARPGQILLSAVAEPLVRRAARELGERGDALQWRAHGRWRFKGMPEVQEIHEVGEPGLAVLRMPKGDAKAHRDIPLWRRPLALIAEAALVAGMAVGIWFITRPEPAIAFSERDWVVVGDLRNLTGQAVLDDSLQQALRISLTQSRYVNVLSDLKVRQTLEQMRLDPDTVKLDRGTASQVALRDGARAVILPTIGEVNDRLQFSLEIVDPATQATVYTEHASGRGLDSVLDSIDEVSTKLRGGLGEALASVKSSSTPLPKATTADLDALRAYALAEAAMAKVKFDDARLMYESAVQLDPEFARAHLGLASIAWAKGEQREALRHVRDAERTQKQLMPRDRLFVDAWGAEVSPGGNSLPKWLAIARLYPDDFSARSNASWYLMLENRFQESLDHAKAATVPQAPRRGYTLLHVARAQTAMGHPAEALETLAQPDIPGTLPSAGARAEALLLLDRRDEARQLLSQVKPEGGKIMWLLAQRTLASMALEEGDSALAIRLSAMVRDEASTLPAPFPRHFRLAHAVMRSAAGEKIASEDLQSIERELRAALSDAETVARHEDMFRMATLVYIAQRNGNIDLASTWLAWLTPQARQIGNPLADKMVTMVSANQQRLEGRLDESLALLAPQLDGTELFQARVVMRELSSARKDAGEIARQEAWLSGKRGLALSEAASAQLMQPLNLAAAGAYQAKVGGAVGMQ